MADWEITRPLGQCSGTGRVIEAGEEYYGALVETDNGLERRDFCADYWQSEKPEVFCYWKSRLPSADEKKPIFVDDEMLMAFFERLGVETDQEKLNFRFVLALVLMRKRLLKYEATKTDGGQEIWTLRVVGSKELVDVVNPHLDDEQVGQLTLQMGEILHTDL